MNTLTQYMLLYAGTAVALTALTLFVMRLVASKIGHRISVVILLLLAVRILIPTGFGGILSFPMLGEEDVTSKKEVVILPEAETETETPDSSKDDASASKPIVGSGVADLSYAESNKFTFQREHIPYVVLGVWIVGAVVVLLYQLYKQLPILLREKSSSSLPDNALLSVYHRAARRVGVKKAPRLAMLEEDATPHLCGIFSPVVYVGAQTLSENEQFYILCHELAHYKRKDTISKVLLLITMSVFWWNPLVYYYVKFTDQEIECACDETVLAGRTAEERYVYGETILRIIKSCKKKTMLLSADFGKPEPKATLKRFKMLLDPGKKRGGWIVLVLCIALFSVTGVLFTCAERQTIKDAEPIVFYVDAKEVEGFTEEQLLAFTNNLEVPEREGYRHNGWKVYRVKGADGEYAVRFEPVYVRGEYEITLITNDGRSVTRLLTYGESLPAPSRQGYTFGGWYSDASFIHEVNTVPGKAIPLYAEWKEEASPGDFVFQKVQNGLKLVSYHGSDKEVIIPSYVGGIPVVALETESFAFMTEVTSVWLPYTVTQIGAGAFRYCYAMEKLHLSENVSVLDASVLEACYALKQIYFTGDIAQYRDIARNLTGQYEVICSQ